MNKKPTNWIQGLSVQERKKQGITTVMPGDKGFGKILDKDGSVHYDVGQVDVKVNKSHMNKLRVLHMTMSNWEKNNGKVPMDSRMGRMYEADLHKVEELVDEGLSRKAERGKEFLTKEEMLDMNVLFKTYGGKRKTND